MANRERGEVSETVGGKVYTLRPTFNALCELEDLTGQSIDDWLKSLAGGRIAALRAVVWCLLQDKHAAEIITLEDAGNWIERSDSKDGVLALVERAFSLNMPEGKPGEPENPPSAQAGTGEPSSSALVESV